MSDDSIEQMWRELWFSRFNAETPRLRFELGGEEFDNTRQHVPRFLQAHRRACEIVTKIFSDTCFAVVAWHPESKPNDIGIELVENGFQALELTGFCAKYVNNWQADLFPEPEEEDNPMWEINSYDVSSEHVSIDTLLWHAIAYEMPIYPSAPITTFLIDPKRELILHVYDDRGMDVWSSNSVHLAPIYQRFGDWLLDYDRERMAQFFQPTQKASVAALLIQRNDSGTSE